MTAKNTIFSTKKTLNCHGKLLDISTPVVMGIINVTPDSFYDGGKLVNENNLLQQAEKMLLEGAAILDVGGMSSRPGATIISEQEELSRVIPAVDAIHRRFPDAVISIDTFRSTVLQHAVDHGASFANDISGGAFDPDLWKTVARLSVPYVLMHMQGTPATMQAGPGYENATQEIFDWLKKKILQLQLLGIHDVVVDPGFGFGKTIEHNFQLLSALPLFRLFGLPILAGISRKSMICQVLKINPADALNGTTALNTVALLNGAGILRVHDVKEARETIQLIQQLHAVTV
ncbi:MAG: dihydropteroate synthase [Chitinophagales bacterium]|nr:dihydropteroate synthase [Chitinophagales bacterium]